MSPKNTTRPLYFWCSSNDRCPPVKQNELLRPSLLLHRSLLFLLLTFVKSHAGIFFQFLPFFIHCCLCCGNLHGLRHSVPNYNVAMNCHLSLQYGPHDVSVEILPYAVLWVISLATGLPMLVVLANLARHGWSHCCFQFSSCVLNDFLKLPVLKVNEIDSSKSSCIFELWLFNCPFMFLPQLSIPCHSYPEFWP